MVTTIPTNQIDKLSAGATASVVDLKQTKTVLGHVTHLYSLTITNTLLSITGKMWVAQDLPDMGSSAFDMTNPAMGLIVSKVKGFPLEMHAQLDMPMMFGQLGLNYVVTTLSTDPLPPSTFTVPSDFTKANSLDPNILGPTMPAPPQTTPAPAPTPPNS